MKLYWTKRIMSAGLVLITVLALNFFLFRIMPGDPASTIMDPSFSPEAKERLRQLYGLDLPLWKQFIVYIRRMITFDFGLSFMSRQPIWQELTSRLPNTIALLGTATIGSALLGIWLGVKAAVNRGEITEKIVLWASAMTFSFPSFFIQLVLLMFLAYMVPLFPLRGTISIPALPGWHGWIDYAWHMALPAGSLIMLGFGGWAMYVRNLMIKTLSEDYVFMARARGLSPDRVIWGHAFRSILPPILTIFLMSMPGIVSGAVITEAIFSLHGVGTFLLQSVTGHDYPASGAAFYLLSLITVGFNLLADFVCQAVDPRIRLTEGKR